jgi:hypothetical protein
MTAGARKDCVTPEHEMVGGADFSATLQGVCVGGSVERGILVMMTGEQEWGKVKYAGGLTTMRRT